MKKRISFLLAIACLIGTLTFSGCGKNKNNTDNGTDTGDGTNTQKTTVSLKIWSAQDDQQMTKQMCEEEGKLMRQYVLGVDGAKEELEKRADNVANFWKKFSGRK